MIHLEAETFTGEKGFLIELTLVVRILVGFPKRDLFPGDLSIFPEEAIVLTEP